MSLVFAALLFSAPVQVHPGAPGVLESGPVMALDAQADPGRLSAWMRANLGTHADSSFTGKFLPRQGGGGVWLVREFHRGLPVAGSRLALRLDPQFRLRQVVGLALRGRVELGSWIDAALPPRTDIWWPGESGLEPARLEDDPIRYVRGHPEQKRRAFSTVDGRELAAWSILDEADLPILGWTEDPVVTPDPQVYMTEVFDASPPLLQNDFIRVVECNWSAELETCDPDFGAPGDPEEGWQTPLPELDDEAAQADLEDPWAGPNSMQLAMRFLERLESWGWSREVWDQIDCEWQGVPTEECQLWYRVNVEAQDEEGVFPFTGAYYSTASGIYMGQAFRADTSFDGDIVIHEIGHHVTRGFGSTEASPYPWDRSRRFVDRSSINEGTSDFFARQMSSNDRIYDYFSSVEPGIYTDDRIRDVSIDFRCPENLTGEVHMDGRIWVSALRDAQLRLAQEGLVSEDEFMSSFLLALAAIRQIPYNELEQFPPAIEILIDEFVLGQGAQEAAIVRSVFDHRGLRQCHRTLDIRENPYDQGTAEPGNPLDARFIMLSSWSEETEPEKAQASPLAPPVTHTVTMGEGETSVRLRYRPRLWRPKRPDAENPPFIGAMLVKGGVEEIAFWVDPETKYVFNDAHRRIETEPQGEDGWAEVLIADLVPGETYQLAFTSLTQLSGDRFIIENMSWQIGDEDPPADTGGEGEGDGGVGTESGGAQSGDGRPNEGGEVEVGCACDAKGQGGGGLALIGLLGLVRRRRWPPGLSLR